MEKNEARPLFTLFGYKTEEGNFDYERYRNVQEAGNLRKLGVVWVQHETMEVIADYLKSRLENISEGICHGTRRGLEQKWLSELTGANVLGTEISKTGLYPSFPKGESA